MLFDGMIYKVNGRYCYSIKEIIDTKIKSMNKKLQKEGYAKIEELKQEGMEIYQAYKKAIDEFNDNSDKAREAGAKLDENCDVEGFSFEDYMAIENKYLELFYKNTSTNVHEIIDKYYLPAYLHDKYRGFKLYYNPLEGIFEEDR